jgi:predicted nucleotide-binding protein (sugar kinase/HSP70/actin superfamily)
MHMVLTPIFAGMGLNVLVPPPINKETLEIGAKYAPETACIPFKLSLGNFIQALELGADTIVTCGGVGPCRLGYYAEIQRNILYDLGYRFELIAVEPRLAHLWQTLKQLTNYRQWLEGLRALRLAGAKLMALDDIERQACFVRPREIAVGTTDSIRLQVIREVDEAPDVAAVKRAVSTATPLFEQVECLSAADVLKVGLVGEIYVMLEPFINNDLMRRLGRLGVEVYPTMLLGDYIRTHILKNNEALKLDTVISSLAAPYLGHYVGGHGLKSIGHSLQLGQRGFDGIIQVFPFTCMPEVIAKNILPQVSRDENIPILSLAFDEQTGAAGLESRLEAFVDLLRWRRQKSKKTFSY